MSARRWIAVSGVSMVLAAPLPHAQRASAAAHAAHATPPSQPHSICTVRDERLPELSGLAVGPEKWYVVNDGGERLEVFALAADCTVRNVISDPTDPYDVEDLARGKDGTLWLADIGDNSGRRETVALHALRPTGGSTLYRLTYPTDRYNAEALAVGEDGTPYIFTKTVLGDSGVYRPAEPLESPGPTPLEKVGTVHIPGTDTPGGPVAGVSSLMVTAAAFNRDHTVLVVRTYTDAYLYPAPDGDVTASIERAPVRIPLPNEPQGEAVALLDDGTLVTASEGVGEPIRAIPGAAARVAGGSPTASGSPFRGRGASGAAGASEGSADDGNDAMPMIPAIAVAAALAAAAAFVLSKMRKRG